MVKQPAVSGIRFIGVMTIIIESGTMSLGFIALRLLMQGQAICYSCLLVVLITTSLTHSYGAWIVVNSVGGDYR